MATEYISRDSICLNKQVFYHPKDGIARNNGYDPADWAIRISDVMDVPAADVRPVVHGKWVHGREVGREYLGDCLVGIFYDRWTCSECGYIIDDHAYSRINYNFCPTCGADMREG